MAEITIPGMFLSGDHASRPAASAVGDGSLYSCTDHGLIYQSDGSSWTTWATLGGTVEPWAVVPDTGTSSVAEQGVASNNQAVILPATVRAPVTVTGIYLRVVTASGNISVALYDESLNRLATSGSVACPAAGLQTVSFSAPYDAAPGRYWLGLSASTTAAIFRSANLSGHNTFLAKTAGSHHPLPNPFVPTASDSRAPVLIGLVSGGWAP